MFNALLATGRTQALTFVASATGTGTTVTVPGSAAAGDLAFIFDSSGIPAGTPTKVVPSGFAELATALNGTSEARQVISWKRLVAADLGAAITGMDGTAGYREKIMLVFRPVGGFYRAVAPTWGAENTNNNPTAQVVSAAGVVCPLIVFGAVTCISTKTIPFSTASPAFDAEVYLDGGTTALRVGYKVYNSAPADHTIDMNDLGNGNALFSGLIRCQ